MTFVWSQLQLTEQPGRATQDEPQGASLWDMSSAGHGDTLVLLRGGHQRWCSHCCLGRQWSSSSSSGGDSGKAHPIVATGTAGAAHSGRLWGGSQSDARSADAAYSAHRVQRCEGLSEGVVYKAINTIRYDMRIGCYWLNQHFLELSLYSYAYYTIYILMYTLYNYALFSSVSKLSS